MPAQTKDVPRERLDKAAWIEASLDLLCEEGIDGVRVEVLAKRLRVTKGSFYWHFKNRPALHEAMLDHWRRTATLALIERLDSREKTRENRFRRLMREPLIGPRSEKAASTELAIRMWSQRSKMVAGVLAEVDQLRLSYIASLLECDSCGRAEAHARAVLAYSFLRVSPSLLTADDAETMERCEDILLGQRA